jgi:hypothetical protein
MSRYGFLGAALLLGASCAFQGTPVPITGETALLEGDWEGTYSSRETGRTGSILFRLVAGTDSAYGDVLMIPSRPEAMSMPSAPQIPEAFPKMPRALAISFVRCEDGEVTGRLDPYLDPDTGERVYTTFEGRLRDNEFRGTFTSLYPGSGHRVTGTWFVKRVNP